MKFLIALQFKRIILSKIPNEKYWLNFFWIHMSSIGYASYF